MKYEMLNNKSNNFKVFNYLSITNFSRYTSVYNIEWFSLRTHHNATHWSNPSHCRIWHSSFTAHCNPWCSIHTPLWAYCRTNLSLSSWPSCCWLNNSVIILLISIVIIQHVSQNIFCVFQSFSHFSIVWLKSRIQRKSNTLSFFVNISY